MGDVKTIEWKDDKLCFLDYTKLPAKEEYIECSEYTTLAKAIKTLAVRGAPAIGVSAAYGVALAANRYLRRANMMKIILNLLKWQYWNLETQDPQQ